MFIRNYHQTNKKILGKININFYILVVTYTCYENSDTRIFFNFISLKILSMLLLIKYKIFCFP